MLLAGSTMPDWSVGEGPDKTAPWSSRWGVGLEGSFLTPGNSLDTEIPMRKLQEIPYLGEEGSAVRRRMKSSGKSLKYLEATRWDCLSLSRNTREKEKRQAEKR